MFIYGFRRWKELSWEIDFILVEVISVEEKFLIENSILKKKIIFVEVNIECWEGLEKLWDFFF